MATRRPRGRRGGSSPALGWGVRGPRARTGRRLGGGGPAGFAAARRAPLGGTGPGRLRAAGRARLRGRRPRRCRGRCPGRLRDPPVRVGVSGSPGRWSGWVSGSSGLGRIRVGSGIPVRVGPRGSRSGSAAGCAVPVGSGRGPGRLRARPSGSAAGSLSGWAGAGGPRRLRGRGRRARGPAGLGRSRHGAQALREWPRCPTARRPRRPAARGRAAVRPVSVGGAVAVQVVAPHEADEVRPVVGVGGVDAGERGRELVRMLVLRHGLLVVAAAGQQPAVVVDALRGVVVDAEGRRGTHRLPVHVLLGGHRNAAGWAGALDAEQVVVLGGQLALPPARLVNGLGDGDRSGYPVTVLGGYRARRDLADERLLGPRLRHRLARR